MKFNERALKFLTHVGTFGFLTNRDAADLVVPEMAAASALVTMQTLGQKLAQEGLLLSKKSPLDNLSRVYVLTSGGADFLNDHYLDAWVELDADGTAQWFGDGYALSFNDAVTRRPVIELLREACRLRPWLVVGQRGLKRNFLGLQGVASFDACLLDPATKTPEIAIYLAHSSTATSVRAVRKLSKQPTPFAIAAHSPAQLNALQRWRAMEAPLMSEGVQQGLGLDA